MREKPLISRLKLATLLFYVIHMLYCRKNNREWRELGLVYLEMSRYRTIKVWPFKIIFKMSPPCHVFYMFLTFVSHEDEDIMIIHCITVSVIFMFYHRFYQGQSWCCQRKSIRWHHSRTKKKWRLESDMQRSSKNKILDLHRKMQKRHSFYKESRRKWAIVYRLSLWDGHLPTVLRTTRQQQTDNSSKRWK